MILLKNKRILYSNTLNVPKHTREILNGCNTLDNRWKVKVLDILDHFLILKESGVSIEGMMKALNLCLLRNLFSTVDKLPEENLDPLGKLYNFWIDVFWTKDLGLLERFCDKINIDTNGEHYWKIEI